jgi:prepilin-type N-terminal cleavage/methylation domain-containing protein
VLVVIRRAPSCRAGFTLLELVIVLLLLAILIALLLPFVVKVSDSNSALMSCRNNMKQLVLAVQHHNDTFGSYPLGTVADSAKAPEERLSCFVALLPFIEQDNLYKRFDMHQGLRSAENKEASVASVRTFLCWAGPPRPENVTFYVGVAGAGPDAVTLPLEDPRSGFFGYSRTLKTADVKRGAANVLVFLETRRDIGPWAAGGPPTVRGVDVEDAPLIGEDRAFGLHAGERPWGVGRRPWTATAALLDGSVRQAPDTTSPAALAALATIAGADEKAAEW